MSVRLENDTTTTHITELYVPRGSVFSWLQVIDLKDIIAIRVPFLDPVFLFSKQRSTYTLVLDVISLNIPSGNDVNRLSKSVLKESFDFCDKWNGGNLSPEKQMKGAADRNRIKFRRQLKTFQLKWGMCSQKSITLHTNSSNAASVPFFCLPSLPEAELPDLWKETRCWWPFSIEASTRK